MQKIILRAETNNENSMPKKYLKAAYQSSTIKLSIKRKYQTFCFPVGEKNGSLCVQRDRTSRSKMFNGGKYFQIATL